SASHGGSRSRRTARSGYRTPRTTGSRCSTRTGPSRTSSSDRGAAATASSTPLSGSVSPADCSTWPTGTTTAFRCSGPKAFPKGTQMTRVRPRPGGPRLPAGTLAPLVTTCVVIASVVVSVGSGAPAAASAAAPTITPLGTLPNPAVNGKDALYAWGAATLP